MFEYGNEEVVDCLLGFLNDVVDTGHIPNEQYDTNFGLFHKEGKADDANNWRPIANFQITYHILARLVYNRIRKRLDENSLKTSMDLGRDVLVFMFHW